MEEKRKGDKKKDKLRESTRGICRKMKIKKWNKMASGFLKVTLLLVYYEEIP